MNKLSNYFPSQRVSTAEKNTPEWYIPTINYIIASGQAANDRDETDMLTGILRGDIPMEMYKKVLNPYNSTDEKYKRFPATMRNYDILSDIVRRYVSEYIKDPHDFIVSVNNNDIILERTKALKDKIYSMAESRFNQILQQKMMEVEQQMQAEQAQQMQSQSQQPQQEQQQMDASQSQPQPQPQPQQKIDKKVVQQQALSQLPTEEEFIAEFQTKYIDNISKQGQELLDVIEDMTEADIIYPSAFGDWINYGECYSYRNVINGKLVKEIVPVREAYPIHNGNEFIEDHDMFARKQYMSYQQIVDVFKDDLTDSELEFISKYHKTTECPRSVSIEDFNRTFYDRCGDIKDGNGILIKPEALHLSNLNPDLIEVWHVQWASEVKRGLLTFQNEAGFIDTRIVDEEYTLIKGIDISIEWTYEKQIMEAYRIGAKYTGMYKRIQPLIYQRNGKLSYNGISELLPGLGKFSVIKLITPFQVARNIFAYHREMIIAKSKMLIMLMPKSLLGDNPEATIHKMAADGVLYYDDSEDSNNLKASQIRTINGSLNQFVSEITALMESLKQEARDTVDMTPQRYGEIANSAGAGTTREAIVRGSMGSVVVVTMFDKFRERDNLADMDFSKLLWIDGLNTGYQDKEGKRKYLSLDVNSHIYADYVIRAKNSKKESDKLDQLKQFAFSAAQNGDLDMALAAITGNNVAMMKDTINKFIDLKRKHESDLKQLDQQLAQAANEQELNKLKVKGDEDRKTLELKAYYEMQSKYTDMNFETANTPPTDNQPSYVDESNAKLEQSKLQVERDNKAIDYGIKQQELAVKVADIKSKERIAKTNKNKYD